MNYFNSSRMDGALDTKFQRVYNRLLDILNEQIRRINVTITNGLIISSDGTTISILTASATQSGALSSTDWTTFNNKQNHSNELDGITNLADTAGFVKKTGDGAYAIDTNSYLNLDQTIPDTTVGTLAFPDFKITDQQLGTPTYSTLGDYFNTVQSSGRISGMVITAHTSPSADGSVDVGVGTGIIKTTNALGADTKFFDYAGGNVALTDLSLNYIYLYYDTGTASVKLGATTNRSTIHTYDQFTIGRAYRQGTTVDIVSSGVNIYNEYRRIHDRLVKRYGFAWASGSTLSESNTRKLAVSDGVWYIGNTEIDTTGFNTNVSGTFNLEYTSDSGSTWTINSSATQLGNTQYNNIASGLTSLGVSKYANYWVYICPEGDLYVVYGQVQYNSLAEAQVSTSPSVLRNYISANTRLIARITFKQGATNFASISNALVSAISATASTTHNNLGGLQGGTTDEYYHMTSAQNTNLGTVTSAGWALLDDASASAQRATLGAGDVNGPASSTDNHVAQFNGVTGKLIEDSGYPIDSASTASTIPIRDAGGNIFMNSANIALAADATAATHYFFEKASDGYVRRKTLANVKTEIVTPATIALSSSDAWAANDDTVRAVTPPYTIGWFLLYMRNVNSITTTPSIIMYRCAATLPHTVGLVLGSGTNLTTGVLSGTTGTDGKLTVSSHTDGKIYIENRTGDQLQIGITFMGF